MVVGVGDTVGTRVWVTKTTRIVGDDVNVVVEVLDIVLVSATVFVKVGEGPGTVFVRVAVRVGFALTTTVLVWVAGGT